MVRSPSLTAQGAHYGCYHEAEIDRLLAAGAARRQLDCMRWPTLPRLGCTAGAAMTAEPIAYLIAIMLTAFVAAFTGIAS